MTISRYPEHVRQAYHAYTQGQLPLEDVLPFEKKTVAAKLLENLSSMHNMGFYKSYTPDDKPYRPRIVIISVTPHEPFSKQNNNTLSAFYIDLAHHYQNLAFLSIQGYGKHPAKRHTYLDGLTPDTLETIAEKHQVHHITKPELEQAINHWQHTFDRLIATNARDALKLSCREQLTAHIQHHDHHAFTIIKKYLEKHKTAIVIHHLRHTLYNFLTEQAEKNKTAYTIMLVKR